MAFGKRGRVTNEIALGANELEYVMLDRMVMDASEIEELKTAICANGLRLPARWCD